MDDFLSVEEVARLKGRHPTAVRAWCSSGLLPARKLGRVWFIAARDAEGFRPPARGRRPALAALLDAAVADFPAAFHNVNLNAEPDLLLPLVVDRLRKYGGMPGIRRAIAIEKLAGKERVRWP